MQVITGDITKRKGYICLPICMQLNKQEQPYLSKGILYYYRLTVPNLEEKIANVIKDKLLVSNVAITSRHACLLTFPIRYHNKDPYNISLIYHSVIKLKLFISKCTDDMQVYIPFISDEVSDILQRVLDNDRYIIIKDTPAKSKVNKKYRTRRVISCY